MQVLCFQRFYFKVRVCYKHNMHAKLGKSVSTVTLPRNEFTNLIGFRWSFALERKVCIVLCLQKEMMNRQRGRDWEWRSESSTYRRQRHVRWETVRRTSTSVAGFSHWNDGIHEISLNCARDRNVKTWGCKMRLTADWPSLKVGRQLLSRESRRYSPCDPIWSRTRAAEPSMRPECGDNTPGSGLWK